MRPQARLAALAATVVLATSSHAVALVADRFGPVIRAAAPRYRRCAAALPDPYGTITVAFTVAQSGWVTEVTAIRDDIGDPAMTLCVLETTLDLRFPTIREGTVRVSYPLHFGR